ncbi:MAG: TonB family protein, partial [Azonexus sp.]
AARETAAREAAAREAAGRQEAARADEAIREQNARRDSARRAMGRQLDEEADRRDAARAASRLSPSSGYLRRGRLFGRIDSNAELVKYAEAVSRKIHFNSASDTVFALAKQAHNPPMVTVAIRSDGSVESVSFIASSGVPAIDDAIRRIVQSQAPYPPFPPGLTRDYDVLEIRRTWHIDTAIRLY